MNEEGTKQNTKKKRSSRKIYVWFLSTRERKSIRKRNSKVNQHDGRRGGGRTDKAVALRDPAAQRRRAPEGGQGGPLGQGPHLRPLPGRILEPVRARDHAHLCR